MSLDKIADDAVKEVDQKENARSTSLSSNNLRMVGIFYSGKLVFPRYSAFHGTSVCSTKTFQRVPCIGSCGK